MAIIIILFYDKISCTLRKVTKDNSLVIDVHVYLVALEKL